MTLQKQFSGYMLKCLLMIWLLFQANHAYADGNKVDLAVYYESLCPFCANFIVNELVKVVQTDLISIVNLRLVPWGNTQISSNKTWVCQHGVDECRLDIAEACAINVWPRVETHFKFIHCIERLDLMNKHTEWLSCFRATGLDPTPLRNCYNNGYGFQLEKNYADETANLNPPHRFVPWVIVNNHPLQEDYQNFIAFICRVYQGNTIPQACKLRSHEINSSQVASSTTKVCSRREKNLT